jgi:hypothetical protein
MNDEAREELNRILALEPAALTEDDHAFLMARRSYLTEEQKTVFGVTENASVSADISDESAASAVVSARKARKNQAE